MLHRLKHLYLLINALREMQADSFPLDSFYVLTMDVLRDAFSEVRAIASRFGPTWRDGIYVILEERPRVASKLIPLVDSVSSSEVDNPVRTASLLGTALPLLREFYSAAR
ncbi:MAG: hypothetical protein GXN93_03490, partial [Candidatus Diapherotrites archaeon]|nr:hypothetical protein [Candidatus Diapherotrites archaeon]